MSMNFERDSSDKSVTEQEGVLFAQPIWERRSKKRGVFGRKTASTAPSTTIAPEPRSFAVERDDETLAQAPLIERPIEGAYPLRDDYIRREGAGYGATTPPTTTMRIEDDASLVAPIGRPTARTTGGARSKSMGPAAIAAGVVTLGALGAVGWYASRGNDGVPELAAGPTSEQVAAAPMAPVVPAAPVTTDMSVNPPSAAPPRVTVPAASPVRTARARPAAAATPSAGETGVNASTTAALPEGPQPYSTLNPGALPPALVTPPATTEAAPAPTEAPAAIPATPPIETPAPTEAAPETTVTPPTS